MVKYIYLETLHVRNVDSEIPKINQTKLGILPYELNIVEINEGDEGPTEDFDIQTDKVIETRIRWVKVLTLEEHKELAITKLKNNTLTASYDIYPQHKRDQIFSGLNGIEMSYTLIESQEIANKFKTLKSRVDEVEVLINAATTKEEIDLQPNILYLGD